MENEKVRSAAQEQARLNIDKVVGISGCLADSAIGIARLFKAESLYAIKSVPRMLAIWFGCMLSALLVWITVTASIGWLALVYTGYPGMALLVFLVLQILLAMGLYRKLVTLSRSMQLPRTRENLARLYGEVEKTFAIDKS